MKQSYKGKKNTENMFKMFALLMLYLYIPSQPFTKPEQVTTHYDCFEKSFSLVQTGKMSLIILDLGHVTVQFHTRVYFLRI